MVNMSMWYDRGSEWDLIFNWAGREIFMEVICKQQVTILKAQISLAVVSKYSWLQEVNFPTVVCLGIFKQKFDPNFTHHAVMATFTRTQLLKFKHEKQNRQNQDTRTSKLSQKLREKKCIKSFMIFSLPWISWVIHRIKLQAALHRQDGS